MNERDYNDIRSGTPSARQTFGIGWKIFAAIAILALLTFGFRLIFAPVAATVGVVEKTLDPNNVVTTYEWFFDVNAQYESRKKQIRAHNRLVKDETNAAEKSRLNIELSGMQQSCRDLAAKYNANSSKLNQKWLKSDGLPVSLDLSNCDS